jgi:hypothetical protein
MNALHDPPSVVSSSQHTQSVVVGCHMEVHMPDESVKVDEASAEPVLNPIDRALVVSRRRSLETTKLKDEAIERFEKHRTSDWKEFVRAIMGREWRSGRE